ncbi:MAG: succinate dehydrogenase, hydrophobic membrane anchor protein [Hyphomicrobiaceae bacterium]|nr:succinate dehydrogenase, hydrophobic membrane anchor protein [Hyphomicrobiaceae bacterium]
MSTTLRPTPSPTEARIRTPLARARGLGSAKSGTDHFWWQRVTAVANVVLVAWLTFQLVRLAGADYASARAALKSPLLSLPLLLFVLSGMIHMRLGMQTIIEDYATSEGCKVVGLMLNTFFVILVGMTCVYAVLKLSFGA